jgi:hypothetical protein
MCSTPDIEVLVEPTVGGGGLLLSQGVVFHDTQHPSSKTQTPTWTWLAQTAR